MPILPYVNIEDDVPATGNLWNSRFAALHNLVNGNLDGANIKLGSISQAHLADNSIERIYPVGSVYINATDSTNPATLLGVGSWEAFGQGRVPVGYSASETEFNSAGKTGGHKELQSHTHSGTTSTNGEHTHNLIGTNITTGNSSTGHVRWAITDSDTRPGGVQAAGNHNHTFTTSSAGGGNAGNLQPYITVYMWRRVS